MILVGLNRSSNGWRYRRPLSALGSLVTLVALLVLGAGGIVSCAGPSGGVGADDTISVVATENFWGSIAAELGGAHVRVSSIVTNPNADPHEYQASVQTARIFATARYVILNGAGYDSWAEQLLAANPEPDRRVLTVSSLLGKHAGDNPHFWYNPDFVNRVVEQISRDYQAIDPGDTSSFSRAQSRFEDVALKPYHDEIASIRSRFAGRKIGATESIFVYMADALGLDLITPPVFMDAIAEGNDPPAGSVAEIDLQIQQKQVSVLIYNTQTNTDITTSVKLLANQENIPIVGVSETLEPTGTTFQDWQYSQLVSLEQALAAAPTGG
jgi:zinc/manganese transport system substrate-binding protein